MAKKNKFYMVEDIESNDGYCNFVIAPTAREAKKLGAWTEFTESLECWTDLRVKAIKDGQGLWFENSDGERAHVIVGGKGFVYTDLKPQVDSVWALLEQELKNQGRYIEEEVSDDY